MNFGMLVSCAKKLDEDVVTLETVSGHSIEALIKLFAEGYTLTYLAMKHRMTQS